jgi:predicted RNA-binding Zn-ribbon protein involved in translation (DUF1610 family)
MPYDKATLGHIAEEEEEEAAKSGANLGSRRSFDEFECPSCSANNPFSDFRHGDEVNCSWCGMAFTAVVDDEGKLKLRET